MRVLCDTQVEWSIPHGRCQFYITPKHGSYKIGVYWITYFYFEEAVAISQERKKDLVIFLLDFEKAYDRVDWSFLRGTMEKLGFPSQLLTAISTLYNLATSKVLVVWELGHAFSILRSARQGCPLAPFLYLMEKLLVVFLQVILWI